MGCGAVKTAAEPEAGSLILKRAGCAALQIPLEASTMPKLKSAPEHPGCCMPHMRASPSLPERNAPCSPHQTPPKLQRLQSESAPAPHIATPPKHQPGQSRFGPRAEALRQASKRAGAQTARRRKQLSQDTSPSDILASSTSTERAFAVPSQVRAMANASSVIGQATRQPAAHSSPRPALSASQRESRKQRHQQIEQVLAQVRDVACLINELRRDVSMTQAQIGMPCSCAAA